LSKKNFTTILSLTALAVLTACGGGGGGGGSSGTDGSAMSYSLDKSGTIQAVPGSSINVTANTTVRAVSSGTNSITKMSWSISPLTGTGTVIPLVSDPDCLGMSKSANLGSCSVAISIPDNISSGTWNVLGTATASNGSSKSSSFTIQVGGIQAANDIALLSVSNLPIQSATNSVITLPANYAFTNGLIVPSSNISFNWTQTSGAAIVFAGQGTSAISFIPSTVGTYAFTVRLSALINGATQIKDTTVVVVVSQTDFFNLSAGPIQSVNNNSSVSLNATLLNAGSGLGNVTYAWSQTGGSPVTLNSGNNATATFVPTVAGNYTFKVVASTTTYSQAATTQVTVMPSDNLYFYVNAGEAQTLSAPNSVVSLKGTFDGNAGAKAATPTYAWTQTSGPVVTLSNGNSLLSSFIPTTTGTYVFQLSGTISGVTQVATTQVNILGQVDPNYFYVDAGNAQSIIPTTGVYPAITLAGIVNGGSGLAGQTQVYAWTQLSGPVITLSNASSATASFVPPVAGTYVFQFSTTINGVTKVAQTTVVANP
jgi:hypothetical protein